MAENRGLSDISVRLLRAKARGDKTYVGNPCGRCGGTLRYVRNRHCHACEKARYEAKRAGEELPEIVREIPPEVLWEKPTGVGASWSDARDRGLPRYHGRPCKYGHTLRCTSSRACVKCSAEASRARREADPEAERRYQREWARKNPDKARLRVRRHLYRHPEKRKQFDRNRSIREQAARGGHSAEEAWRALEQQGGQCAHCGTEEWLTKDHIVPLAEGGTDFADNIQWLCRPCNSKKGARRPVGAVSEVTHG